MSPTISIQHVQATYENDVLFENLSLTLKAGKCTCLLGPSGVGKTTLLRLIAGLHSLTEGKIEANNGVVVSDQVAYMAQTDLLMPWLTALDNALLSVSLTSTISQEKIDHAIELFKLVGLKNVEKKFPNQLSGGMRQRVALVRTFLQNKPIVLMDEPFSAVDAITRFQLQTIAAELLKNRTSLLVTHDPLEALRLADEIYIMSAGHLSHPVTLNSSTPRDVHNPEFLTHQATLFDLLLHAKEVSA